VDPLQLVSGSIQIGQSIYSFTVCVVCSWVTYTAYILLSIFLVVIRMGLGLSTQPKILSSDPTSFATTNPVNSAPAKAGQQVAPVNEQRNSDEDTCVAGCLCCVLLCSFLGNA